MNRFPDFNKWHKVPQDATIPTGTPYWRIEPDTGDGYYLSRGLSFDRDISSMRSDYYTEEPILSPAEAEVEKRAREMYYSIPSPDIWEHLDWYTHEAWFDLARKYVEK